MDIKLKNRHRLAVILILATIVLPAFMMMGEYPGFYEETVSYRKNQDKEFETSSDYLEGFVHASYVLHIMEHALPKSEGELFLQESYPEWLEEYNNIYPYLEYTVWNEEEEIISKSNLDSEEALKENNLSDYGIGVIVHYDANGVAEGRVKNGKYNQEQTIELRKILNEFDIIAEEHWQSQSIETSEGDFEVMPKNRTYIFAMTGENMYQYMNNYMYWSEGGMTDSAPNMVILFMLIVAAAACIYPVCKTLNTGNERVFLLPVELAAIVFIIVVGLIFDNIEWIVLRNKGAAFVEDFVIWAALFAVTYWTAANVRHIFTMGPRKYLKSYSVIAGSWKQISHGCDQVADMCRKVIGRAADTCRKIMRRVSRSFDQINFEDGYSKFILKAVLCNFLILAVICSIWYYGIIALMIYSVVLFLILRSYFERVKGKYAILLNATNQMAEGDLDVVITEDLGIFNPFKDEMEKIRSGFKNAVEKEVKSQRMKTELITNVSHDLKTPLTAIITYVDLLKDEEDEEKRREYTQVLERKSLRLKVLIEDLFEISKANSSNVTLHIVDVDIVNLFKQVKLEHSDKITDAGLDFRCTYPEEKVIVPLDSQKTYRIFENLLVNVIKYAMPHTRVYVEIAREQDVVAVRMKNVSEAELNFNPEEVTERFVRGDASRNTEGSGLGLAIVKSFVELQKGKFWIETEADLFKVEIQFGT